MHGLIELGESVTWQARHFGVTWTLTSRVIAFERPHHFSDEQLAGPFRSFRHDHLFREVASATLMVDEWTHVPPFGLLGRVIDVLALTPWMERLLRARASAIAVEAEQRSVPQIQHPYARARARGC